MRILVRSEGNSPEWGHRKKRRRRRRACAIAFVLLALAGVGTFIYLAYRRNQGAQFIVLATPQQIQLVTGRPGVR